jgi:hypothetical protein
VCALAAVQLMAARSGCGCALGVLVVWVCFYVSKPFKESKLLVKQLNNLVHNPDVETTARKSRKGLHVLLQRLGSGALVLCVQKFE